MLSQSFSQKPQQSQRASLIEQALHGEELPTLMLEYFVHNEVKELLANDDYEQAHQIICKLKQFQAGRDKNLKKAMERKEFRFVPAQSQEIGRQMTGFDETAVMRDLLDLEISHKPLDFEEKALRKLINDLTHMHLIDLANDLLEMRLQAALSDEKYELQIEKALTILALKKDLISNIIKPIYGRNEWMQQEQVDAGIAKKFLSAPTYYLLEFQVGKFSVTYKCKGCRKDKLAAKCEQCEGKNLGFEPKKVACKVLTGEQIQKNSSYIKPAYLEMLRNPKKIFRNFKGDSVRLESMRSILNSEYFLKSDTLDKTFILDGNIELVGRKAVKNRPIVFATLQHLDPLQLEFLRQINHPTDKEFTAQEKRKDMIINQGSQLLNNIKQDRAKTLSKNYEKRFIQIQRQFETTYKKKKQGQNITIDKCLCETWSEQVKITLYTSSDAFPSTSMILDVSKVKQISISNLIYEKSLLIQRNSKLKQHITQMDKDLDQRKVKLDHKPAAEPDQYIKTEFIPQPLMFLLDNVFTLYDEKVLRLMDDDETHDMVQFHFAIVEYIELLEQSYQRYRKWIGKPETEIDQDLIEQYSQSLARWKSKFSDLYQKCGIKKRINKYHTGERQIKKQQNLSLQVQNCQFDTPLVSSIMCTEHKGLHYFESACMYSKKKQTEEANEQKMSQGLNAQKFKSFHQPRESSDARFFGIWQPDDDSIASSLKRTTSLRQTSFTTKSDQRQLTQQLRRQSTTPIVSVNTLEITNYKTELCDLPVISRPKQGKQK